MSVLIGDLEFEGPYLSIENLQPHPHLSKWQKICPEVAVLVHYTNGLSIKERKNKRESAERKRLFSYAS